MTAPWGDEVDGRRLLHEVVGFGQALRAAGLAVDLGAAVDYARALPMVDMGEREQVRAAGEAVFVRRRDDREIYDAVFDRGGGASAAGARAISGPRRCRHPPTTGTSRATPPAGLSRRPARIGSTRIGSAGRAHPVGRRRRLGG